MNRLKIAERERDNLSSSKADAEMYRDKENQIRRKQNVLYQIHVNIASENIEKYEERLEKAMEKYNYEKSKLKTNEDQMNDVLKQQTVATKEYHKIEIEVQKSSAVRIRLKLELSI